MKNQIPKRNRDLSRYILRKKLLRVFGFVLWMSVFCFSALGYNRMHQTYPPSELMLGWKLAVWLGLGAGSGTVLFRIYRLFTDRNFEGTVCKSRLSHTYTSTEDPGAASTFNYRFRVHTVLTVRTAKGKKKKIRFEEKPGFYLYYYEGSYLRHISGLPYPVCDPGRACRPSGSSEAKHADDLSGGYLCAVCGHFNSDKTKPCVHCGRSIIDPEELFSSGKSDAGRR